MTRGLSQFSRRENGTVPLPRLLGGWAGTIAEILKDGMYTVRWSKGTLDAIHPVFKKRCEKDGLKLEEYWLGEDDLGPDTGAPLEIEHPKKITTKPLSPKELEEPSRNRQLLRDYCYWFHNWS
ncbi:MAG: hypothetical protein ABIP48_26855 [Planctomycetota bacterium]